MVMWWRDLIELLQIPDAQPTRVERVNEGIKIRSQEPGWARE